MPTMANIGDNAHISDDPDDDIRLYSEENDQSFQVVDGEENIYRIDPVLEGESALANVTLKITNHASGDNYQVYASLDPTVPDDNRVETTCMVAWKRMKVNLVKSYRNGTCLASSNDGSNILKAYKYDSNDLSVGDQIIISESDQQVSTSFSTVSTVTAISNSPNSNEFDYIEVDDIGGYSFNQYSSIVKLEDSPEIIDFQINLEYIESAYGKNTCGDCGAFVEYVFCPIKSVIPNLNWKMNVNVPHGLNTMRDVYLDFMVYWNGNLNGTNTINMVWGSDSFITGVSESGTNNSAVFIEAHDIEGIGILNEPVNSTFNS